MPDPLVSIVTPCFNAARYLEETIESIHSQDYPAIEHIVMDGGSTDGTLAILEHYADRLRYRSGPDAGAADAINRGWQESRGDIVAYLNADDCYLPGAVRAAAEYLQSHPQAAGVYGEGFWIDEHGRRLDRYPTKDFDPALFASECFLCQPTVFLRRETMLALGGMDASLRYTFDYDFWIRLARRYTLDRIPTPLALSRMHHDTITLGARRRVFTETHQILRRHFGYVPFTWIYSDACFRLDARDQFFEPLQPSPLKYLYALFLGTAWNWRCPLRFWREWSQPMTLAALRRFTQRR